MGVERATNVVHAAGVGIVLALIRLPRPNEILGAPAGKLLCPIASDAVISVLLVTLACRFHSIRRRVAGSGASRR
jgi:hypothetical protein